MANIQVQDVRGFDPKAVQIAQYLDSSDPADYRRVEKWLKDNNQYHDYELMTLVELFDREQGLPSEATPHPNRPQ